MPNIPDNYALFLSRENRQQQWLDSLQKCDYCNEPIQDEKLVDFDGTLLCLQCVKDHYTKDAENYMR